MERREDALLDGGEDTGGLDDVVGTDGAPWDRGGVLLSEDGDGLAVHDELAVDSGDVTLEAAVDGVVLEHVDLDLRYDQLRRTTPKHQKCTHHVGKVDEGAA